MNSISAVVDEPIGGVGTRSVADEVLRWLLRYPLLSVEGLAAALGCSSAQCYRLLADLLQRGWVEAVTVPALHISRARLYHLSRAGARALAEREGSDPSVLARRFHAEEPHLLSLLIRAPALVAVQTLICGLVTQAPVALASAHRPCHVAWSWVRDYQLTTLTWDHGEDIERTAQLLLDAYLILRASPSQDGAPEEGKQSRQRKDVFRLDPVAAALMNRVGSNPPTKSTEHARWYACLILCDSGLLPERLMARRLHALLRCREAPERWAHAWAGECAAFPPLLVLTPATRRAVCWCHAARTVVMASGADPLRGGALVMTARSLGAPWHAGWHTFDGNTIRRLVDLLIPIAAEALPPMTGPRSSERREASANALQCPILRPATRWGMPVSPPIDGARLAGELPAQRQIIGRYNDRAWQVTRRKRADACQGGSPLKRSLCTREQLALAVLRLGARHMETLRLLHDHPLLSRVELGAALAVEEMSAARYLSSLLREGLVCAIAARRDTLGWSASTAVRFTQPRRLLSKQTPESAMGCRGDQRDPWPHVRYLLSDDGIRLLAAVGRLRPRSLSCAKSPVQSSCLTNQQAKNILRGRGLAQAYHECVTGGDLSALLTRSYLPTLLRYPAHTAGVYTFFATLLRDAESRRLHEDEQELVWWETGAACIRRYRYHLCWRNFRPDGAGEYLAGGVGGRRIPFWLEWDRGTMGLRDLREKFVSYAEYVASHEWMHDASPVLPRLLVVTSNGAQQVRVAKALATTLSTVHTLAIFVTTSEQAMSSGPLSDIWRPWLHERAILGPPTYVFA